MAADKSPSICIARSGLFTLWSSPSGGKSQEWDNFVCRLGNGGPCCLSLLISSFKMSQQRTLFNFFTKVPSPAVRESSSANKKTEGDNFTTPRKSHGTKGKDGKYLHEW